MKNKLKTLEALLREWKDPLQAPIHLNEKIFQALEQREAMTWGQTFRRNLRMHRFASILVLAIFIVGASGAGVTYAANEADPGEWLYPLKLHVSEPLMTQLTFGKLSKAELATQLAERRYQEIQILEQREELPPHLRENMRENWQLHRENAERFMQDFERNRDFERTRLLRERIQSMEGF